MWDELFCKDPAIRKLWRKLDNNWTGQHVRLIYDAMHDNLAKVWAETYRVLIEGGIAAINIGDATRSINGKMNCYRWKISGAEVPPKIEDVLSRFEPKQPLTATA